jgi:hypothetical protein
MKAEQTFTTKAQSGEAATKMTESLGWCKWVSCLRHSIDRGMKLVQLLYNSINPV